MTKTSNFFAGLNTPEAIKKAYNALIKEWHPDRVLFTGKDKDEATQVTKVLNNEYHEALSGVHKHETPKNDGSGESWTYYYNAKKEQAIIDKIDELLGLGLSPEIEIVLIGFWIWVYDVPVGKPGKEDRKKLGKNGAKCRWHSKRNAWYWRQPKHWSTYNKDTSLEGLAQSYGIEMVRKGQQQKDEELVAIPA